MHLYILRLACAFFVVLVPVFGVLYEGANPSYMDPMWIRIGFGVVTLAILVLTFVSEWVRSQSDKLLIILCLAITLWSCALVTYNHFTPDYAIGLYFTWIGAAILVSIGFDGVLSLILYFAVTVPGAAGVIFLYGGPEIDPMIFSAYLLSGASSVYVASGVRIRVQEALREREAHLAEAQHTAGLGNWEVVAGSGHVTWSDEMFKVVGLDPDRDAASFDAVIARMHFDDRGAIDRFFDTLRRGGEPEDLTFRLIAADGALRSVRIRGAADLVRGRAIRLYGIALDVTAEDEYTRMLLEAKEQAEKAREEAEKAREQAEEAREQAEEMARLKSAFLANMSHEIRTPLTSIIGFAQVLAEEVSDHQREFVEPIEQSGRRLLATLNSVLDLAQLRSERMELQLGAVDVAEEAHDIAAMLRPLAQKKGVALTVHAPVYGVAVYADHSALQRVLTNLLSNAIKFTDEGRVMLSVDVVGVHVCVRVRDTGCGISQEFLPKLFEEFHQESTGTTRSHEGSGLGLAITRGLVELMGGTIEVESVEGEGTVFTVVMQRPGHVIVEGTEEDKQQEATANQEAPAVDGAPAASPAVTSSAIKRAGLDRSR